MGPPIAVFAHLGPGGVPLPFTPRELLEGWVIEPVLVVAVLWFATAYLVCWTRIPSSRRAELGSWRPWVFLAGLVTLLGALGGPLDRYGNVNAAIHMVQHMVLLYLVTPLLVAGAPFTVIRAGLHPAIRRRWVDPVLRSRIVRFLSDPWIVGAGYVGILYATHFTGWYEAALQNEIVHDTEHLAYIVSGFALWTVLLGRDGRPVRRSGARRLLVVLAIEPAMVLLAALFLIASEPLYPHYVALPAPWGGEAHTLAAQQAAAGIMWGPSSLATMVLLAWLIVAWYREDVRAAGGADVVVDPVGSGDDRGVDPGEGAGGFEFVGETQQRRLVTPGGGEVDRTRQTVGADPGR